MSKERPERFSFFDKEPPYEAVAESSLRTSITSLILPALFADHDDLIVDREDARDILASVIERPPKGPAVQSKKKKKTVASASEPAVKEDGKGENLEVEKHGPGAGDKEQQVNDKDLQIEASLQSALDPSLTDEQADKIDWGAIVKLAREHSCIGKYEQSVMMDGADDDWSFGHEDGDVVEDCRGFLDFMAVYSTTCDKTPTDPKEMQVDEFGPQEENPDEEAFDETVQFGLEHDEEDGNQGTSPTTTTTTVKLEQTNAATAAAGPLLTLPPGDVFFVEDDDDDCDQRENENPPAAAEAVKIHADDVPPSVPTKELEVPSGGDEGEPKAKTDSEAAMANDRALEELQQKTASRFSETTHTDDGKTSQKVDKLREQADSVVAAAAASASKSEEKQPEKQTIAEPESVQDLAPTTTTTLAEDTEAVDANDESGGAGQGSSCGQNFEFVFVFF